MFARRTNWNFSLNRLSKALAEFQASGQPLIDLTVSNPIECGLAMGGGAVLAALANPDALRYQPHAKGLESARQSVAHYYADHGCAIEPDDVLLTASTTEAYSFIFRTLCDPGDEILIPAPSYPLFDFLAEIQDVKLVRYALVYDHGWQIDFPALAKALSSKTRGVIVVHPNNPTGHFTKQHELSRLNELCSARQIALIADEVFSDYGFAGNPAFSFAANHSVLTFTMSGLSKICGLPQMKASWLVVSGPEHLKRAAMDRLEVIADTFLSVNAPVQHALPEYLRARSAFQIRLLQRAKANLAELDLQLSRQAMCSRLAVEGGWSVVLRVPATQSGDDLAISLLTTHGVYVHPGHFFEFSGEGHLVLSLIVPPDRFSEGIRRILSAF